MPDRYDTLAHWLAFEIETERRERAARPLRQLKRAMQLYADHVCHVWQTSVRPALITLCRAYGLTAQPKTRAEYTLTPSRKAKT